jgi:hypothetical protein
MHRLRSIRLTVLAIGAAALAVGLWSGLARLDLQLPGGVPALADRHGALMICGFFGTLICLERAVALGQGWGYLAPALSATGVLLLLVNEETISIAAFATAGLMLTILSGSILLRHPALFTAGLTVAAFTWAIGTLLWLADRPLTEASGWWLAFLVLTITFERLELSRVTLPSPAIKAAIVAVAGLILAGAARGELARDFAPLLGLGFFAGAGWLLMYDVARHSVRRPGQVGFSATCMLAGYGWLGLAGLLWLLMPFSTARFSYDAALHAVTIGFVLSMVLGHALIILPAVTGWHPRYTPYAYLPLALLHLSVAARVVGDLMEWSGLRSTSGVLTVLALAGFAVTLVGASIRHAIPNQ